MWSSAPSASTGQIKWDVCQNMAANDETVVCHSNTCKKQSLLTWQRESVVSMPTNLNPSDDFQQTLIVTHTRHTSVVRKQLHQWPSF